MYLRAEHAEGDIPTLRKLIRDNPLGILITSLPSSDFPTIQCTHIPWLLDVQDEQNDSELGKLRGHLARQNPHSKALIEAVQAHGSPNGSLEQEVCVLFNGPAQSYVTPKFYVDTKPQTGKVVPTWNYSAAQVYGRATIYHDSHSEDAKNYLHRQVTDLTRYAEEAVMSSMGADTSSTWAVSDAPERYIELMRKNIIGIEIDIGRLEGKFKMSQEKPAGDRNGVINGFSSLGTDHGKGMARTVQERAAIKDARGHPKATS